MLEIRQNKYSQTESEKVKLKKMAFPTRSIFRVTRSLQNSAFDRTTKPLENTMLRQFNSLPVKIKKNIYFSIGKSSDIGEMRRLNEDSLGICEITSILESVVQPVFFGIISDGMGGHQHGEVASRIVIQNLSAHVNLNLMKLILENNFEQITEIEIRKIIHEGMLLANEKVCQAARARQCEMGATMVAALLANRTAFIYNIGDCRAYHFKNQKLTLITEDHSLVFRFYKNRQIPYHEIFVHPQRHQILRCLGEQDLEQNLNFMAEHANHLYWFTCELNPGEALLLCSDGLWEMLPEAEISRIIAQTENSQTAADLLVQRANEEGGEDNISVILIKLV